MEESSNRENPWAWVPIVPRNLLLASWLVFIAIALVAILIERVTQPDQTIELTLWRAIGGNASGVSYWMILGSYLTSEVFIMILTLRRNQYEVEKAAAKARAEARAEATTKSAAQVAEARAEAKDEGRKEERQEWQAWYEAVKDDLENGRPPQTPPPSRNNGNEAR